MSSDSSRQQILQRIATVSEKRLQCVVSSSDKDVEIYKPVLPDSVTCFKNELEAINGNCVLCENEADMHEKLNKFISSRKITSLFCMETTIGERLAKKGISFSSDTNNFEQMEAGITSCEFLVARTGSVVVSSAGLSGRRMNVFPPIHIVLASISQLVNYPEDALVAMQQKYNDKLPSLISTITGPSRTADIEKTLVLGAHGPKEFIVFLSKE